MADVEALRPFVDDYFRKRGMYVYHDTPEAFLHYLFQWISHYEHNHLARMTREKLREVESRDRADALFAAVDAVYPYISPEDNRQIERELEESKRKNESRTRQDYVLYVLHRVEGGYRVGGNKMTKNCGIPSRHRGN